MEPACVLIGCVSRKEPTARAAKDLYRTELFSRRRAYAEASGQPWLIVSALHGLVDPDRVIEPYDVKISDLDLTERQALAGRIADELEQRFGALDDATFEVHAGDEYMQMLAAGVRPRGGHLVNPLRGLRIGEQLAWYGRRLQLAKAPPEVERAPTVRGDTKIPMRHPGLAKQMTAAFQRGALGRWCRSVLSVDPGDRGRGVGRSESACRGPRGVGVTAGVISPRCGSVSAFQGRFPPPGRPFRRYLPPTRRCGG